MVTGFTVEIEIGVNAESKQEALDKVKKWFSVIDTPIFIKKVRR